MNALGHNMRRERERLGWTRAELARRAGLSWPRVWAIEEGRNVNPRVDTVAAFAAALGVPLGRLLDGTG